MQGRRRGLKAAAVIMDDAWFIATITCLPGLSHDDRDGRRNVRVESGICTCRRRIGYRSTFSLVAELVAALAIGRGVRVSSSRIAALQVARPTPPSVARSGGYPFPYVIAAVVIVLRFDSPEV